MFKAIKDNKIIAINETGEFPCLVFDSIEEDTEHTLEDYAQAHGNGEFVLIEDLPAPTDEEQREKRQQAFAEEADPLKYDYEEACARYGDDSDEAQDAKVVWLQKKDEIRERFPYEENEES